MMQVLAAGYASLESIKDLESEAQFRKATQNMKLVARAIRMADFSGSGLRFGLVLATAEGELPSTLQFLKSWGESKVARPLAFQNSLHNSTTGFVTMMLNCRGPSLTVSAGDQSAETALELAESMLDSDALDVVLLVGVDADLDNYIPLQAQAGFPAKGAPSGAGVLWLAKKNFTLTKPANGLGYICKVRSQVQVQASNAIPTSGYHSDLVEILARQFLSANKGEQVLHRHFGRAKTEITISQ